jgi:hypothetical protein
MLGREQAAAFCGLTVRRFNAAVKDGALPAPVCIAGEDLWHVERLRQSLDALAGWAPDAPRGNRAAERVKGWSR